MSTKFDARQVRSRDLLAKLTGLADSELDNLLKAIDSELTPPLNLTANTPADLVVNVGSAIVQNPESLANRSIPHIGSLLPNAFTSGTVNFPSASGGTITVSPGNNGTLTVPSNEYIKVLIYMDANGDLNVLPGVPNAVEANATVLPAPRSTLPIGYVTLFNNAGTIDPVAQDAIFQFGTGAGGGSDQNYKLIGGGVFSVFPSPGASVASSSVFTNTSDFSASNQWGSQSFDPSSSGELASVLFKLKLTTGSLTGDAFVRIYSDNGSGLPSSTVLATSDNVDLSTLTTSYQDVTFNFSLPFTVNNGTTYHAALVLSGIAFNSGAQLQFGASAAADPYTNGQHTLTTTGGASWSAVTDVDLFFDVKTTGPGYSLSFTSDMFLEKKGFDYSDNTVPVSESPIVFPNNLDVAYVIPNVTSGGPDLNVTVDVLENVPDDAIIIARREDSDIIVGSSSTRITSRQSTELYAQESIQSRNKLRSTDFLRSDEPVKWNGTELEFSSDIVLESLNSRTGTTKLTTLSSSASPLAIADGELAYVIIDREAGSSPGSIVVSASVPTAISENQDIVIIAKRVDALGDSFLHIPLHKQVLEQGKSVRLGASGSGSGGASGTIYFEDRNAEDISKISLYEDTAAATPVDGTGGSPNITKSLNTSTPIIGTSSYRISKDAANRQGEGFSLETDIALDAPVKAGEPVTIQFRYRTSANYASGDVRMFAYFVGPNTLEALNGMDNLGNYSNNLNKETGDRGQFTASVSCPATTTAIRVIGHIATTNADAYDIDVDEVTIGTAAQLVSVEKRELTLNLAGSGDFTGGQIKITKTGSQVTIQNTVAPTHASLSGPASAAGLLPEWARPLTTVINVSRASSAFNSEIIIESNGTLTISYRNWSGTATATTGGSSFGTISYSVPETESNILSTTQAAFSKQIASVRKSADQSITSSSETQVTWNTTIFDNRNSLVSNALVVKKKGLYRVYAYLNVTGMTADEQFIAKLNVNGNGFAKSVNRASLAETIFVLQAIRKFNEGDQLTVTIKSNSDTSYTVRGGSDDAFFELEEISDLTVVGLTGQKREYLEIETTSANLISGVAPSTWVVPSSSFTIPLTAGVWELKFSGPVQGFSASGLFYTEIALSTSSTPGSGLIDGSWSGQTHSTAAADRYSNTTIVIPNYTVTSSQNIYVHLRPIDVGSLTTATIGYGGAAFSQARLSARRIA